VISFVILIISLKEKSLNWIDKPKLPHYLLLSLLLIIIAALNEMINLNLGRWQYTNSMPTVFGIGLSPLVQLAATSLLSLLIYRKIFKK